jgi:hypothetical protein
VPPKAAPNTHDENQSCLHHVICMNVSSNRVRDRINAASSDKRKQKSQRGRHCNSFRLTPIQNGFSHCRERAF